MRLQNLRNNNYGKKQKYYIVLLTIVLIFQQNMGYSQFIYRQADRAQIIYGNIIQSSLSNGSIMSNIQFEKPFQNAPKITLSILHYNTDLNVYQGFSLEVINVYTDRVVLKVTTHGVTIYTLGIAILATDFPNSMAFTEKNISGNSSKTYTAPGNIIGYCAFFHGFEGNFLGASEMHFDFSVTKTNSNTIKVFYKTNNVSANIKDINFNGLIIYEDNNFDSSIYSFIFHDDGPKYKVLQSEKKNYNFPTDLSSQDKVLYGFKYISITSISQYNIRLYTQESMNPVSNNKIEIFMTSTAGTIDDGNIHVFQLLMKVCPSDRSLIIKNSQEECIICNPACYGCTGTSDSDCTVCKSGYFYDSVLQKCVSSQPQKQYCQEITKNSQTYQNCLPCHESCLTCSGPQKNQCTSCPQRYYTNFKKIK